jgi:short-subunit dehydrogenase
MYKKHGSGIYPGRVATEFEQHVQRPSQVQVATPGWLPLSAERVAQEVWRIAQRPRRTVVIPRVMWLAVWLNAITPRLVDTGIRMLFTQKMREV